MPRTRGVERPEVLMLLFEAFPSGVSESALISALRRDDRAGRRWLKNHLAALQRTGLAVPEVGSTDRWMITAEGQFWLADHRVKVPGAIVGLRSFVRWYLAEQRSQGLLA